MLAGLDLTQGIKSCHPEAGDAVVRDRRDRKRSGVDPGSSRRAVVRDDRVGV
jgi:hypothetical protein